MARILVMAKVPGQRSDFALTYFFNVADAAHLFLAIKVDQIIRRFGQPHLSFPGNVTGVTDILFEVWERANVTRPILLCLKTFSNS